MRKDLNHLLAFMVVAHDGSFTKAAAKLGMSQSTLSYSIRKLEERLEVRLLTRTTRSVSLTEAGERFFSAIKPHLESIESELKTLGELKGKPAGTIRMSMAEHAVSTVIWPKLAEFLPHYPDIKVEISINYGMIDIVAEQFDAGIRLGEEVAKDMIAVRIGPDMRMAVVGTPAYFAERGLPQTPQDLTQHNCINLRLPTRGNLLAWEFEKDGRVLNVHVEGQLIFNQTSQRLCAALDGLGVAYIPEDIALAPIKEGRLKRVLEDWCPLYSGYHLYYPNRRHTSLAFSLLVEALRYRP